RRLLLLCHSKAGGAREAPCLRVWVVLEHSERCAWCFVALYRCLLSWACLMNAATRIAWRYMTFTRVFYFKFEDFIYYYPRSHSTPLSCMTLFKLLIKLEDKLQK
ncbi:unnamed protein product, partial [Ectocarpus sp. 13 AM-2016]